jgi:hypothetical protein
MRGQRKTLTQQLAHMEIELAGVKMKVQYNDLAYQRAKQKLAEVAENREIAVAEIIVVEANIVELKRQIDISTPLLDKTEMDDTATASTVEKYFPHSGKKTKKT